MDQAEKERLRHKMKNLTRLEVQIVFQAGLLTEIQRRSQAWEGVSDSVMKVLRPMFSELSQALPEKNISFDDSNNIDGLRSQLSAAHSKVRDGIEALSSSLGEVWPTNQPMNTPSVEAADKRRVFVVHGRNMKTKDAMFIFLRAIKLDPIEWEEAVHMTGSASPSIGRVLDAAFSNAQAVVILITGDDVACLGDQFIRTHDPTYEKELTPQARPNVIFEMGMAFGKHPDRTLIVEFGTTRTLSDVHGLNTIRFADDEQSRKKIASRLKTAKCLVDIQHNLDWITAGDFSSAFDPPLHSAPGEMGTLSPDYFKLETECNELKRKLFELDRLSHHMATESTFLRAQLEVPKINLSIVSFDVYEQISTKPLSPTGRLLYSSNNTILIRANLAFSNAHRVNTNIQSLGIALREPHGSGSNLINGGPPAEFPEILQRPIVFGLPVHVSLDFRLEHADAQSVVRRDFIISGQDGAGQPFEGVRTQIYRVRTDLSSKKIPGNETAPTTPYIYTEHGDDYPLPPDLKSDTEE